MTARPSLVCAVCGSSDVHVMCGNPNCPAEPWDLPAPPAEVLPELRDLAAKLEADRRRVQIRRQVGNRVTAVQFEHRAQAHELDILDLLRTVAA